MNVVVLVPWRTDNGHRARLWEFCRAAWLADHPEWPIYEGCSPDGPFNRSAAINDAAAQAGDDWDVAVVLDTDVLIDAAAVRLTVETAAETGRMVISHRKRVDFTRRGTEMVLAGERKNWRRRPIMDREWPESDSSCIAVPKSLWDTVGGFDERFRGWGYEDTAFRICCEAAAGDVVKLDGDVYHLWHERASTPDSPLRAANLELLNRYRTAVPKDGRIEVPDDDGLIPRIFHRTVPEVYDPQWDVWWEERKALHPSWEFRTYQDPIDPALFPLTSPLWGMCETGAQKADLIRLEALLQWGGVYVDADCKPIGRHDTLRGCQAYAAWEDETTIPNAVVGARAGHPAIKQVLDLAIRGVKRRRKTYQTGVALTTRLWANRDDMTILPPGIFYDHHYLQKHRATEGPKPWEIERHMWAHSWADEKSKRSIEEGQRR